MGTGCFFPLYLYIIYDYKFYLALLPSQRGTGCFFPLKFPLLFSLPLFSFSLPLFSIPSAIFLPCFSPFPPPFSPLPFPISLTPTLLQPHHPICRKESCFLLAVYVCLCAHILWLSIRILLIFPLMLKNWRMSMTPETKTFFVRSFNKNVNNAHCWSDNKPYFIQTDFNSIIQLSKLKKDNIPYEPQHDKAYKMTCAKSDQIIRCALSGAVGI